MSTTLPGPAAAPDDSIDHQIERAFIAIRDQIADGSLPDPDAPLSAARIRRLCGIGELAAGEVVKHLEKARLILPGRLTPSSRAQGIASTRALVQLMAGAQPPDPESSQSADGLPPWMALGEPLRVGDATDSTMWCARATRRHPEMLAPVDPLDSWQELRSAIGDKFEPDFAGSDGHLRGAFEAAWQSLSEPTLGGSAQTDAILLTLCQHRCRYRDTGVAAHFADYLVARHGLPYAIDTLIEAMSYGVAEQYVPGGANIVRLQQRVAMTGADADYNPTGEVHWLLRAHLAVASQEVYDACAATIRKAMDTLDAACQVALALLLPDMPELTHALIGSLCSSGAKPPAAVHWLQLTATDPNALALARKVRSEDYGSFWNREDLVSTVLLEHGLDAVRWLAPGADRDPAGDALTRIGTPEAFDALARVASTSKNALARFILAAQRWPVAAMAALARLVSGPGRDQALWMPTLLDLVRSHPSLPSQLRPWLEPAANGVLETLAARLAGPTDIASAAELPPVLAEVPWLQPKKKALKSLQLSALPLAPIEHWEDGEKAAILALSPWSKGRYQDAQRSPDAMADQFGFRRHLQTPGFKAALAAAREAIADGKDASGLLEAWRALLAEMKKERWLSYTFNGVAAAHLPPALGVPFWNAAAGEASCSGVAYVAAAWGLPALPGLLAQITRAPGEYLAIGLHFGTVELGPIAARAFAKLKSLRSVGRAWLQRFPEHAACALIAPALGKPSEARDNAAASLRYLASIGHGPLLDEVAARYGQPAVLPALHAMLGESPLERYPNKRTALPPFWKPVDWTRPQLHKGKALPDDALDTLGTMLAFPTTEEVYAGLVQVKDACSADSLAGFAWDCFSAWLNAGAPVKEAWALAHLGMFGSDDTARKLTPLIRAWPGEAAHARAVAGLDVLAAIGSDVALMLLNGIAQKVKFKGLQDKAREKIEAIAAARSLSAEELEDRLAPDLGLDDTGSLVLDFGPRAFKVGFDEALAPYVREWQDGTSGARLPDLPKPKKSDDAALAKAAAERFKLLKKDARTIASQQVLRLEVAMCTRRRWSGAVFAGFMANHPLVRHLVRRLVWGVYLMPVESVGSEELPTEQERRVASHGGALQACFRVAEDGAYTSAADDPFSLPEGEQFKVGLPHALELPAGDAAAFGQLLADYELLQPFAQLGRDTYALTEAERGADKLLRWNDLTVPTGKVLGLANTGWRRGPAQDAGRILTFEKTADTGRTLELMLEPGIIVGMVDEFPQQKLGEITLTGACGWGPQAKPATFDTLDAILASELIRDMERLRA